MGKKTKKNDDKMEVTVLPISGGSFPYQVGILKFLVKHVGYDSELLLGSSGGSVAAYILHEADFKYDNIDNVACSLTSQMFCREWSNALPILGYACGYMHKGAIFRDGTGGEQFLRAGFDNISIQKREIWSGTYNITAGKSQLFCNRSMHNSLLGKFNLDKSLYQICDNIYCGGNINLIADAIMASASIPGVVPAKNIGGHLYQDGGLSAASPMTLLNSLFDKYDKLNITYINSEDLNTNNTSLTSRGVLGGITQARDSVIKNIIAHDRMSCSQVLFRSCTECRCDQAPLLYKSMPLNEDTIHTIYDIIKSSRKSLTEYYTDYRPPIDITNFTSNDVIEGIRFAEHNSYCNIWYCL